MTLSKVSIAVAGHTNVGKTTLIRTLMRSSIGEVKDSANVTKKGTAYYFDGLQATFIDTPGFQQASAFLMYLDNKQEDPNFKLTKTSEEKLKSDMDMIEFLANSHIVIYMGNLSVVPDDAHKDQISIVRRIQPRVVAVLNQERKQLEASDKEVVDNRIKQWTEVFKEKGIESIVVFDAHWDKPAKVDEIYNAVRETLAPENQDIFQEGLNQFKNRQVEIRKAACTILSSLVLKHQELSITTTKGKYIEKDVREKLAKESHDAQNAFLQEVCKLYILAAQSPTISKDELLIQMKSSPDYVSRFGTGAFVTGIGAGLGAGIGACIGVFAGGVGAAPGAIIGAQVGTGAAGVLFGLPSVLSDSEDQVEVRFNSSEIQEAVALSLATIWGLSNAGFGRGLELAEDEIKGIKNQISNLSIPSNTNIRDWTSVSEQKIISYCEYVLDTLEKM